MPRFPAIVTLAAARVSSFASSLPASAGSSLEEGAELFLSDVVQADEVLVNEETFLRRPALTRATASEPFGQSTRSESTTWSESSFRCSVLPLCNSFDPVELS